MPRKLGIQEKILETLRKHGTLTPKEIAQYTGLNYNSVRGALQKLTKKDLVKKMGRGKYTIP